MNRIAYQCDDILNNLNLLLPHLNKIELHSPKQHKVPDYSWPGKRSFELSATEPFLFYLVMKSIQDLELPFLSSNIEVKMYMHLREKKDASKDFIHRDSLPTTKVVDNKLLPTGFTPDFSGLIYLNETNTNAGTYLYNEQGEIITDFKYVQNRFVIFSSAYLHKGYGHFGNSCQNGRTTLNIFIRNAS